jgi:hypothetical protein
MTTKTRLTFVDEVCEYYRKLFKDIWVNNSPQTKPSDTPLQQGRLWTDGEEEKVSNQNDKLIEDKPNPLTNPVLRKDDAVSRIDEGEVLCTCGHIKRHHQSNEDLGCVALGLGRYACHCSKFCEDKT